MGSQLQRALRRVLRMEWILRIEMSLDRADARRLAKRAPLLDLRATVYVIPTAGGGNIGDQAMLESYLEASQHHKFVILVESLDSFRAIKPMAGKTVEFLALPALSGNGGFLARRKSVRALLLLLADARRLDIVGADIMDGGYSRRESVARTNLAIVAASVGIDARVLGFSWNSKPDPVAASFVRRAAGSVDLLTRDPESYRRMVDSGIGPVTQAADLVFMRNGEGEPTVHSAWLEQRSEGSAAIVVNCSGLLLSNRALLEGFRQLVSELLTRGVRVLVLPHVIRDTDDDLAACAAVVASLPQDSNLRLVTELASPDQVAAIVRASDGVVTARMHLSILALEAGKPAAVVTTQGKVEGLLQMFGLDDFVIQPTAFDLNTVMAAFEAMRSGQLNDSIQSSLQFVKEHARLNVLESALVSPRG